MSRLQENASFRPAIQTMAIIALLFSAAAVNAHAAESGWKTMTVKASSYTLAPHKSRPTKPRLGAFGDVLSPGDKVVAVSRDLLRAGLTAGTRIRIEGLSGTYTVLDKMHRRWRDKIDILFDKRKRAREWGVKTVTIRYLLPK